MNPVIAGTIAILLYSAAGLNQTHGLISKQQKPRKLIQTAGLVALFFHLLCLHGLLLGQNGLSLSLFNIGSLIFAFITAILLASSISKPIENVLALTFPLTAITIFCSLLIPAPADSALQYSGGMLTHILSSILAYSLITIAACQAVLVAIQNKELKQKHIKGIIQLFPPLQTMESLLFEMLSAGLALLTISIATGMIFLDDMLAQHLAHKTVLSIIAWVVFATLLLGRYQLGWRGNTAIKGTLIGFTLLMLAYFGSNIVLQLILQRN